MCGCATCSAEIDAADLTYDIKMCYRLAPIRVDIPSRAKSMLEHSYHEVSLITVSATCLPLKIFFAFRDVLRVERRDDHKAKVRTLCHDDLNYIYTMGDDNVSWFLRNSVKRMKANRCNRSWNWRLENCYCCKRLKSALSCSSLAFWVRSRSFCVLLAFRR